MSGPRPIAVSSAMVLLFWLACVPDPAQPKGRSADTGADTAGGSETADLESVPTGTETGESVDTVDDTTETADGVDTGDSATTDPGCTPTFGKVARWDLPASGADASRHPWGALASGDGTPCGSSGRWAHDTMDVDGDGILDVIIAADTCRDTSIGGDHWEVHLGTGAGFDGTAETWPLPSAGLDLDEQPWFQATQHDDDTACAAGGTGAFWHLGQEVDGDSRTDLLVLENGCDDPTIGQDHWVAFLESGAGFTTELTLVLPDVSAAAGSRPWTSGGTADCAAGGTGAFDYSVVDLDGDGWMDLLVTRNDCEDPTIGEDHWLLYPANGAGFDAATRLDLPDLGAEAGTWPWDSTTRQEADRACASGGAGGWAYSLEDLGGDGLLDVIVTWNGCDDTTVGVDHWSVLAGTGAGFDPAVRVDVPLVDSASPIPPWWAVASFDRDARCTSGGSGDWGHSFEDVDGDGIPDLLVTVAVCLDPTVGADHWVFYPGTGSGYGGGVRIDLPDADAIDQPWGTTYAQVTCDTGAGRQSFRHATTDVNGDALPDLVVTLNPCTDDTIGQDHWAVYLATCGSS